jgi:beta-galactosidase
MVMRLLILGIAGLFFRHRQNLIENIMKKLLSVLLLIQFIACLSVSAQQAREAILLNNGWKFAYGHAGDMKKDFTHGTEYFTYFAKAKSFNQNQGPSSEQFNDSTWQTFNLPHDWVVDLPFSKEASHSHGYKTVGWKYPETSVGWYRRKFYIPEKDLGKHISVRFDGIFRNAQVFCNGFYLGHEPGGYATQVYDLTEYLNYGGENLLTVRVDASTEEGWYYEGAGIYRDVWLDKMSQVHVAPFGTFITTRIDRSYQTADVNIEVCLANKGLEAAGCKVVNRILDATGKEVVRTQESSTTLASKQEEVKLLQSATMDNIHLWDLEHPYLYTLYTDVYVGEKLVDTYTTSFGIRNIEFNPQKGFLLNGCPVKLKGTNLHQDHAGVGTGIPDRLWKYRIEKMKSMGSNAIRTSHNPVSPAMLDLCDRMGMLVIEENRLMGINKEHVDLLERMIKRDRNHPCIILWSIGNEEWALEGNERGLRITQSMSEYVHQLDSTRLTTQGTAGGRVSLFGVDVKGYNYLRQNPIDEYHREHPDWYAPVGSEETSGCGTRNVYYTDSLRGWMAPINRTAEDDNRIVNAMARGWQFYHERPWLAGLFYWTGLDYRGEPNPMLYPATGSQFGIFDYCGFPKDEAFYLKSWWTDEPVLHLSPHWNLSGHEGDSIRVWAYSNCDEVELFVNGKNLGRKPMPADGYIEWKTVYRPGALMAKGYKGGKKIMVEKIETTGKAARILMEPYNTTLKADGQDIAIVDLTLKDENNREVPDAMNEMTVTLTGPATILGYGNGDPGFKETERPVNGEKTFRIKAFAGKAQVIIRSLEGQKGTVQLEVSGTGLKKATQQFITD